MQPSLGHTLCNSMCLRTSHPQILFSYATSEHLEILEFKVPNLAAQSHIDAIAVPDSTNSGSLRETAKCITFWDPLIILPLWTSPPCGNSLHSGSKKTVKTVQSRDPISKVISNTMPKRPSLSNTKQPLPALKTSKPCSPTTKPRSPLKPLKTKLTEAPPSIAVVQDIIILKRAFPSSFNIIGNMSWTYIRNNPSVPPVQHT